MPTQHCIRLVLSAFFRLGLDGRVASRPRLAAESGLSPAELRQSLVVLERAGLVDTERLCLTLPGLAVAAASFPQARRERARLVSQLAA